LAISIGIYGREQLNFLFPVPNSHKEFLAFPRHFLPHAPRLQAASSLENGHMQVSQCCNKMGTKFHEVVTDEHGIGGGGEYCGDNDA
jgi:hypothetical protein